MSKKLSFIMPIGKTFSKKSVESFSKMFKQDDVEIFIAIVPKETIDVVDSAFKELHVDKKYVILSQDELLVNALHVDNFLTLAISNYIQTQHFVELNNEMIFTKPFSYTELLNTKNKNYPPLLHTKTTQKMLLDLRGNYKGYYINLNRDKLRNTHMQEHIKELNFENYTRFEALDGKELSKKYKTELDDGSLGCGFSHKAILEENLTSDKHLHVAEDDALFHSYLPKIFKAVNSKVDWDIIYTDIYFSMLTPTMFYNLHEKYKLYKAKGDISVVNLRGIDFSGATSYFVNKNSIKKLNNFLGSQWYKHEKHDAYINSLVQTGELKAFVTVPFVSSISKHSINSTIDETYNSNMLSLDILRKSFYIDANHKELSEELKKSMKDMEFSDMVEIYTDATKIAQNNLDKKLHVEIV